MDKVHDAADRQTRRHLRCPSCSDVFVNRLNLTRHLHIKHDIDIVTTVYKFDNCEEFLTWKENTERATLASFAQVRRNIRGSIKRTYYNCHRSGTHRRKGDSRKLKVKGSNRIGGICPAAIRVDENTSSGKLTVYFTTPHVGHENEVGRLRLLKQERQDLAEKLQQGVPKAALLSAIRENIQPNNRIGVTSRQDLLNIAKAYKIKVGEKAKDEDRLAVEEHNENIESETLNVTVDISETEEFRRVILGNIEKLTAFTAKCATKEELQILYETLLPVLQYVNSKCLSGNCDVLKQSLYEVIQPFSKIQTLNQSPSKQKPINVIVKLNEDIVSVQALLLSNAMESK